MADVVFTVTAIKAAGGARVSEETLGATVTAGQAVYKDAADGTLKLADADVAATGSVYGIALNGGATGQACRVLLEGDLTCDGLTKGTSYFLSPNAGGLCGEAEVLSGDYVAYIGTALATTSLRVKINNTGIAK